MHYCYETRNGTVMNMETIGASSHWDENNEPSIADGSENLRVGCKINDAKMIVYEARKTVKTRKDAQIVPLEKSGTKAMHGGGINMIEARVLYAY